MVESSFEIEVPEIRREDCEEIGGKIKGNNCIVRTKTLSLFSSYPGQKPGIKTDKGFPATFESTFTFGPGEINKEIRDFSDIEEFKLGNMESGIKFKDKEKVVIKEKY